MKKIFAVLFCSLVMVGSAFADELSYEIDLVATANAPWKVREIIIKEGNCRGIKFYREFLGITQSGLALVQDFYLSGEKLSNPFLMTTANAENNIEDSCWNDIEGQYTLWYKNGQKRREANYKNGKEVGLMTEWYENGQKQKEVNIKYNKLEATRVAWYENGQKAAVGNYKNGKEVGMWQAWDENGNLIAEIDFDTPED